MTNHLGTLGNSDDSPNCLTGGAWLPSEFGVLRWVAGAKPAPWQDVRRTACGSMTGVGHHHDAREPLCELCRMTWRDYYRNYRRSKKVRDAA